MGWGRGEFRRGVGWASSRDAQGLVGKARGHGGADPPAGIHGVGVRERERDRERRRETEEVTGPLPSTRPYTMLCWGGVAKMWGMESVLRSRGGLVGAARGHGGAASPAGPAVTIILHYPYIFDSYEWSQCMQQATR